MNLKGDEFRLHLLDLTAMLLGGGSEFLQPAALLLQILGKFFLTCTSILDVLNRNEVVIRTTLGGKCPN